MLLLYSHTTTPRLRYIIDFFSRELFDEPVIITNDKNEFRNSELPKVNYSDEEFSEIELFIRNVDILFETGIKLQNITCFEMNYNKAFFQTSGDFPFDIFAASFFLLSRYEEYLPHKEDEYGRYDPSNSLAFKEGFLHLPLINIWMTEFKKALHKKFPRLLFKRNQFKCILTYDIDIAYSYLHKGLKRTIGGFVRSMIDRKWGIVNERWQVLLRKKNDPYDCYEWLDALHLYCRSKPCYFFLVAKKLTKYDRNTSTSDDSYKELIEYYASNYKVGIHPSWQSGDDPRLLKEEIEWLTVVIDKPAIHSRQHFLRLSLPKTYRQLIELKIANDYSMGYGSINGFRASVASSFNWFDLENEQPTPLMIYPFCFMDANSLFEQNNSPQEAYTELMNFYTHTKNVNGMLITIWHNYLLGTDPQFAGWREMFELFMKETVYWDAYNDDA